ncbi:MAG: MFS transporter [Actinomycetota bacterium]|nr:MFS transporter [Actinomycetota bacterium]
MAEGHSFVRYNTSSGRWVLLASILGSAVAALDATVVNVALPVLGEELDAGLSGLQWTLNGYLLTLSALILTGGALGDRYGRRRIFIVGVVWFTAASLACGLAINLEMLIAARVLQGVGGALLSPASLAIIQASFHPEDRARAVGAWSGLGGVSAAIGPLFGGYMIDALSWRFIFLLNVPLAAIVVFVSVRHVPETHDPTSARRPDILGAISIGAGLAGLTFALIEAPERGAGSPQVLLAALLGVAGFIGFVLVERRGSHPMIPPDIFNSHQFTSANLVTFVVYAALSGVFFLLTVQLQQVVGYSPLQAGMATVPVTLLMLVLSARAGDLAQRIGPRFPMAAGPVSMAAGMVSMSTISAGSSYLTGILPSVIIFGLGLSLTVAPLTATVLASADDRHAGVASGINNAVARVAGLLAVAALPVAAGLTGGDYQNPGAFGPGFRTAMLISAALSLAGGVLAWLTIRNDTLPDQTPAARHHCAVDGTPLQPHHRHLAPTRG